MDNRDLLKQHPYICICSMGCCCRFENRMCNKNYNYNKFIISIKQSIFVNKNLKIGYLCGIIYSDIL